MLTYQLISIVDDCGGRTLVHFKNKYPYLKGTAMRYQTLDSIFGIFSSNLEK